MQLLTVDLLLRTVTENDIDEVARMYEFEKGTITLPEAKEAIQHMQMNHDKNCAGYIFHLCLAVYEKNTTKIIGWCGLDGISNPEHIDIFYSIDEDYRNRGYATQCAARLIEYAFETAKVKSVYGGCFRDNIASYKVLVKTGMVNYI